MTDGTKLGTTDLPGGGTPRLIYWLMLALLSGLLLFANLHRGDLSGYDDAVYAHEARSMILSGDWWNVRFNGYLNFEYPPMFLWMEVAAMKTFGFTDFAAKFPSAVLGVAPIVLTAVLAFELTGDAWLSLFAGVVLLSTQYFMKYATHAMTDVPFTFFVTVAACAYLRGLRNPNYFVLCGSAIGCAILTRSVMGLLPLPAILAHLLVVKRQRLLRSHQLLIGAILAATIPAVWYGSQYALHGAVFMAKHTEFVRGKIASSTLTPRQRLAGLAEYPRLLFSSYWPWLPLLLLGLVKEARRFLARDACAAFLLLWVFCVMAPLSLAETKLLRYLIPLFPVFSILAALPLNVWLPPRRKPQITGGIYFLAGGYLIVTTFFFPTALNRATDMKQLAPAADAHTPQNQRVVMYTGGTLEYNYQNQFLWYGNRYTDLFTRTDYVRARLETGENSVAIMDRPSFGSFKAANDDIVGDIVGESEHFVCFRAKLRK
jgi:4-amino-4-deoxy-L-arabinose transferase-like glycosyltransferase